MTHEIIPDVKHDVSEEETISMIRAVLHAEPAASAAPRTLAGRDPDGAETARRATDAPPYKCAAAFAPLAPPETPKRRATDHPEPAAAPEAPSRTRWLGLRRPVRAVAAGLRLPLRAPLRLPRRVKPRHGLYALGLLIVVLRPHWVLLAALAVLAVVMGAFLAFGAEKVWHGVLAGLTRMEARNPDRATRWRARLDRMACRWDAILDLFPDGMVDALYMPDLQQMQTADAAWTDAMDKRLHQMVREG